MRPSHSPHSEGNRLPVTRSPGSSGSVAVVCRSAFSPGLRPLPRRQPAERLPGGLRQPGPGQCRLQDRAGGGVSQGPQPLHARQGDAPVGFVRAEQPGQGGDEGRYGFRGPERGEQADRVEGVGRAQGVGGEGGGCAGVRGSARRVRACAALTQRSGSRWLRRSTRGSNARRSPAQPRRNAAISRAQSGRSCSTRTRASSSSSSVASRARQAADSPASSATRCASDRNSSSSMTVSVSADTFRIEGAPKCGAGHNWPGLARSLLTG